MPSPWSENQRAEQRSIALGVYYRKAGRASGQDIADEINAHPSAIEVEDGPREIGRHQALARVKEAIADQDAHGDLPAYRAEWLAQLQFALGKVMQRIENLDGYDPSGEHRSAVVALVESHKAIGDLVGIHRLAPVPVDEDEQMTDGELVGSVLDSIGPVDLALLAPDQVRAAAAELDRLDAGSTSGS